MNVMEIGRRQICFILSFLTLISGCQKSGLISLTLNSTSLIVVNAIPGSAPIVPVFNTGAPILYFSNALPIAYGSYREYSPSGGDDTIYVVQQNSDTLSVNSKGHDFLFYNTINLKPGNIYSLFLTGADTNSPDFLFTIDTIPYYGPSDSVLGIRFVNLSNGSEPFSINLEGLSSGSEVGSLAYKSISGFKRYSCNSNTNGYLFVIRDAGTGDSLTQFSLNSNGGYGLIDPNENRLLDFRNITVAILGSDAANSSFPIQATLIEDY